MKILHKILIVTSTLWGAALPIAQQLTPENTVVIFDIDDVIIKKSPWLKPKIFVSGLSLNPFTSINYIRALSHLKDANTRDAHGIKKAFFDDYGNPINGLTFHLLYQGMRDPLFAPYVAQIVKTIEQSRCFIDDTRDIINYLKEKGYEIVFATNKDRISYNIAAKALGDEFTKLPDKVFVAQPGNANITINQIKEFAKKSKDKSYKKLAYKACTIQPTKTIFHAPSAKPDIAYFQYVENNIGPDKNMIFIDDKKINVNGFNMLQETTATLRHGIAFKNGKQLITDLINIGILSIVDDKDFLIKKGMYKTSLSSSPLHAHL
jgi:FMN phosphatase YigB (HAD superfamily)